MNNSDLALNTASSKFFACRFISINSILLSNSSSATISMFAAVMDVASIKAAVGPAVKLPVVVTF
mgnify:CR=1 FL=1